MADRDKRLPVGADKLVRHITGKVSEYPPGHWSNCLSVGDFIWVSGFTSRAADLKTIFGRGSVYE